MLSDATIASLEEHAAACDEARAALEDALDAAEQAGSLDEASLHPVGQALKNWRDAQQAFMDAVDASEAPDVPMAALLLKQTADVDVSNARRGLPGAAVEGANQPFDIDMTGMRGQALTTAAMEVLPKLDEG